MSFVLVDNSLLVNKETSQVFITIDFASTLLGISGTELLSYLHTKEGNLLLTIDEQKALNNNNLVAFNMEYMDNLLWHYGIELGLLTARRSHEYFVRAGFSSDPIKTTYPEFRAINYPLKRQEELQSILETHVQKQLASELNGKREITTPVGKIDILTKNKIIEVKRVEQWKHAIGQVLCYAQFYPEHTKMIYLFSNSIIDSYKKSDIIYSCSLLDIEVDFVENF